VYQLHKIFSSIEEIEEVGVGCATAGIGCIDCKKILLKNIFRVLEPIWKKRNELINNPDILSDIVKSGSEKAKKNVRETMQLVREAMGLY
jgi:tryptophanyl-tRNA synthetase